MTQSIPFRVKLRSAFAVMAFAALSACAVGPSADDPFEPSNRKMHAFNKGLDTVAVRPAAQVYGAIVPEPLRTGVSNFASNLSLPGKIINNTLQGNFAGAADNTGRFIVNSTLGFAGLVDIATPLGTSEVDTDFGETLHVWGTGEGKYVELPFFGPSTTRDAWGRVVDIAINPVGHILEAPQSEYALGTRMADGLNSRYRFADTIDGVLYESADSYAQARLIYLQNRRFELGGDTSATDVDTQGDLYDDLYFE